MLLNEVVAAEAAEQQSGGGDGDEDQFFAGEAGCPFLLMLSQHAGQQPHDKQQDTANEYEPVKRMVRFVPLFRMLRFVMFMQHQMLNLVDVGG